MAAKIQEKPGVFAPPNNNKQLSSYVINITFPQPVIRIRIPSLFMKAMQRRNQSTIGSKTRHHRTASSKKSFRNKVGSVISTVFGKKSASDATAAANGNEVDEEMKKLKDLIDSVDMGSEKKTEEKADEVQPQPVAEGNERAVVKDVMVKERPKSRRTYPKRKDLELNRAKVSNVDVSAVAVGGVGNDTDSSIGNDKVAKIVSKQDSSVVVACAGDKVPKTVLKQAELRSKTLNSNGKPKISRSIKRVGSAIVGGKSEKQELCKKKILMGVRCKPLNNSGIIQYDKNGVLVPDVVP